MISFSLQLFKCVKMSYLPSDKNAFDRKKISYSVKLFYFIFFRDVMVNIFDQIRPRPA